MKKIFSLVFLLFLVSTTNAQSINWFKDFKQASQLAQETGKPMLLDFTAPWCKPCLEMDKSFWTRPDVIELASNFIAVKVDFDNDTKLVRKYYVSAIPNVTTTDPWGNGLNYNRGFGSDTQRYMNQLMLIPKDFSSIKDSVALLEIEKENVAELQKVADFYSENKLYFQSNEYYKKLLKLETESSNREKLFLQIGFNYLRSSAPDDAEDFLKDFQKEFPQSNQNETALFGLAFAYLQKEKVKNAEKIFVKLKTDYPNSKYIVQLESEIAKAKEKKK